jgi:hypothetical protein
MYFTYSSAQNYVRTLTQGVRITDNRILSFSFRRVATQTVQAITSNRGLKTIYRKIQELVKGTDYYFFPVFCFRMMKEYLTVTDNLNYLRGFLRGIFDRVETESDIKPGWTFLVRLTDGVLAVGNVFRGLVFFVRIITGLFVRDYILSRFLKAKSDLQFKSCICLEIVLESKIY